MDIVLLEKQYKDAVRNLSFEQVAQVESGGVCDSPVMVHARSCYVLFCNAKAALTKDGDLDYAFMMQI